MYGWEVALASDCVCELAGLALAVDGFGDADSVCTGAEAPGPYVD